MLFAMGQYGRLDIVVDVPGSGQVDHMVPCHGLQDAGLDACQMEGDAIVETRLGDLPW